VQSAAHSVIKAEVSPDLPNELQSTFERLSALRSSLHWLYRHRCLGDSGERDFSWQGLMNLSDLNQSGDSFDLLRRVKADHNADAQA
jgi:hypothetical protein